MRLNFINSEIYSLHAAALILGAAGLFSRVLGVLRDRLLAGRFGASRELDIYYAAFQIPDFMSILFLLGAGTAAILPIFQEYFTKDKEKAKRLISEISTLFIIGSVAISSIAFFIAPYLMKFITPGFSQNEQAMTANLTRIMLLSPIFLGLSSILSAVIQSFQRFLSYALAPILYNLGIITGIIFFMPFWGIRGIAAGVALGALLHLSTQLYSVFKLGYIPKFLPTMSHGLKRILSLSFRVISVSLSQLTLLVLIAIASTLDKGSISVFQLAYNLYYMPIGIFGASYAIAIFPRMSLAFIERDKNKFFNELFLGVRTIIFWIAPAALIFVILRAHIVRAALGAGVFSWEDTRLTAAALAAFAIAMIFWSLSALLIKAFYALENTWHPLFINIFASILSVFLAVFLAGSLRETSSFSQNILSLFRLGDLARTEILGLALGLAIGQIVNIILLYFALLRLAKKIFKDHFEFPYAPIIKIIAASFCAGIATYAVRASFSATLPLISFAQVLIQGAVSGTIGFIIYFAVLFLLKSEDMLFFWDSLERKFLRIKKLPKYWDGESNLGRHL